MMGSPMIMFQGVKGMSGLTDFQGFDGRHDDHWHGTITGTERLIYRLVDYITIISLSSVSHPSLSYPRLPGIRDSGG